MDSSLQGLTLIESKQRYKTYGSNQIPSKQHRSFILDAISYSTNPLVAILIFAAVISAFTGSFINAAIIIPDGYNVSIKSEGILKLLSLWQIKMHVTCGRLWLITITM